MKVSPSKFNIAPENVVVRDALRVILEKLVVGRLLFYWASNFSGAMLNFGRLHACCISRISCCISCILSLLHQLHPVNAAAALRHLIDRKVEFLGLWIESASPKSQNPFPCAKNSRLFALKVNGIFFRI